MTKSPFYVIQEFVSPYVCEDVVDACEFSVPNRNKDDQPVKTVKQCELAETVLFERLLSYLPAIEAHYGIKYRGTERMGFEWFTEGTYGHPQSENSEYIKHQWSRVNSRDLTGVLFLSDYNNTPPFDTEFEVCGGKLEFAQHQFGFNPMRGTLIIFPSDPHFINATAPILAGELYQARIQMTAATPFIYNPQDYQGNFTTWFQHL